MRRRAYLDEQIHKTIDKSGEPRVIVLSNCVCIV